MAEIDSRSASSMKDKWVLLSKAEIGDIFFSRDRTVVSWIIRTFSGFNYSHVIVKSSENTVIDAAVGGVSVRDIGQLLHKKVSKIEKMPFPEDVDKGKFMKFLAEKLGSYYDYGALLGFLISKLFRISRWRENMAHGASRYFCSELIAEALAFAGAKFELPPSQIMPKDLYYYLSRAGEACDTAFKGA